MTKKNLIKKVATWIIMFIMFSVFLLDIICVAMCNHYQGLYDVKAENFSMDTGNDRIHFLNVNNSDAILLESNGKFALIDSGEGDHNPRKDMKYLGNEQAVIKYLKKVATDKTGKVQLEFVLGTHNHYDHIGAFEAIINDPDISANVAYLKPINHDVAHDYEIDEWGIENTYNDTVNAFIEDGVKVTADIPTKIKFGDFDLTLYNTVTDSSFKDKGENAASIGMLVEKGNKKAFLAADITNTTGLEDKMLNDMQKVDLLKVGHHGYYGSTSWKFAKKLEPDIAIITNKLGKIYPDIKWTLTMICHAAIFASVDCNGIIATFSDNGEIYLTENAQA